MKSSESTARSERATARSGVPLSAALTGLLLGGLMFSLASAAVMDFDPESFGLGHNTIRFEAQDDGRTLSGHHREATARVMESFRAYRAEGARIALWLGASQLHAINAYRPGDELAVSYANAASRELAEPVAFLQASRGNASFHDLLGLYLAFRQSGLVPDHLIVALVYDDLREAGVREDVLELVPELPLEALPLSERAREIVARLARERDRLASGSARGEAPLARSETRGTPHDRLEERLTRELDSTWTAYAGRGRLAAWAELRTRLALRYVVLSAKRRLRRKELWRPTDATPVPEAIKARNGAALDALVELARRDGVSVQLYRQPHRPGQTPFYHERADYDAFFEEVVRRHRGRSVRIADLETLVPADAYGLNNGLSPDVFHFRDEGHRLLGAAVHASVAGEARVGMVGRDALQ